MRRCAGIMLLSLLLSVSSGIATSGDLSTPEKALVSYLRLQKQGATLKQLYNIVSQEYLDLIKAMEAMDGEEVDIHEPLPSQDRYAKLSVVSKQVSDDRAIFLLRANYKESWLEQQTQEMKEWGMVDFPADAKTGGESVSDATPGDGEDYPYHLNGVGYVSFLFVKQDGTWRFHKSYASNQPSDFMPLLKAKDLSGGFSVTPNTEPEPDLPMTVPDQPLTGRHSGREWTGSFVYHCAFRSEKDHYGVDIYANERPDIMRADDARQLRLLGKIPENTGEYPLSGTFNVTFFEPPGNNKVATRGIMKVTREGDTYIVRLIAHFDKDNDVRGYFAFTPTDEE